MAVRTDLLARRRSAFTLIELLSVLMIIGILMGFVLAAANWAREKATMNRATAELHQWMNVLEEYRANFGKYPASSLHGGEWGSSGFDGVQRFEFKDIPDLDPWGNPYRFQRLDYHRTDDVRISSDRTDSATAGVARIRVWTLGPDGADGTPDDIVLTNM